MSSDVVTVHRDHYHSLLERDRLLCALEDLGIDMTDAYDLLEEWDEEVMPDE